MTDDSLGRLLEARAQSIVSEFTLSVPEREWFDSWRRRAAGDEHLGRAPLSDASIADLQRRFPPTDVRA